MQHKLKDPPPKNLDIIRNTLQVYLFKINKFWQLIDLKLKTFALRYKIIKNDSLNNVDSKTIQELNELLIKEKNTNTDLSLKINENALLIAENEKTLFAKVFQISTYHDSISKVSEDINKIINSDSEINASQLLSIDKTLLMILNNEGVWKNFKYQFEKTRPHFYKKLLSINPSLTITDLKYCSYIIARLSSKEVSNLVNTSYRSVETSRYRLKKKLNLKPNGQTISFFAKPII